jgi:hypothetical protein
MCGACINMSRMFGHGSVLEHKYEQGVQRRVSGMGSSLVVDPVGRAAGSVNAAVGKVVCSAGDSVDAAVVQVGGSVDKLSGSAVGSLGMIVRQAESKLSPMMMAIKSNVELEGLFASRVTAAAAAVVVGLLSLCVRCL